VRLEQAREALAEAEAGEEQDRRRALFQAGTKAATEAEKLVGKYAEHAAAIADTLRAIDNLREPIELANRDLPEGESEIDTHAFSINLGVELPAATADGVKFWYRPDGFGYSPLNPPPPPTPYRPQPVFANGRWIFCDDEEYHAGAAAEKSKPAIMPVAQRSTPPPPKYGERLHEGGSRAIKLPPVEWPPRPESAQA
jgi:hypothetical protein